MFKWIFIPSKIQSLIFSFLNHSCVEMVTFMCELQFYFRLTLYNCHLTRLTNTPASALCSVSTAPHHLLSALVPSPERSVSDQAVCGCLSVTHQLSALEERETEQEGR